MVVTIDVIIIKGMKLKQKVLIRSWMWKEVMTS